MFRTALSAALTFATISIALAAEPIGVPACDEFLTKYEVCVADKVPPAQQQTFRGQIEQLRTSWIALARNPQTRPTLESACKTSAEQMKAAVLSFACKF